ncbi:MAG: DNA replication/repair protein RecF [Halofilum sp. (in: g-proteobacteria)]|nr:DNA replication/repair protein RecF [Halofilum sp. (in: g-proteobacteria)]
MRITALDVRDVRCLAAAALEPSPAVNLIVGPNAAGKTSLLEAVHLLATGRSFAAGRPTRMVRVGGGPLRVVARVQSGRAPARMHRLGLERAASGPASLRVDGRSVERVAEMARLLPVVAVHPESHELVGGGPGGRRRLLDQGLFHVEPSFHRAWQRYRRALSQRNALLRAVGAGRELEAWDPELVAAAERMDALRRDYVCALDAIVRRRVPQLIGPGVELGLEYRRGWGEGSFREALQRARARDREQLTTTVGPHRADLVLRWDGRDSRQRVSRGQQKLLVYLLRLGQAEQLAQAAGEGCILLLDDLAAELDAGHRERVLALATDVGAQLFITALDPATVPLDAQTPVSVFHVEQGQVREVIQ